MKARIITSLMALAALLAVSCAKESGQKETAPLPQVPISVEASVSGLTKAVTDGLQTTFQDGDQLTLYAWTGSNAAVPEKKVVSGVVNTFDGTKWTPASTMLWKNVSDAHYFLGIFPTREVSSFTKDPVTSGEDLLVATVLGDGIVAPQTTTAPPVDLVFDHMMARLNVNVKYRNQWGGVPEDAVVVAKAATQGTIDYLTKTITPGEVTAQVLEAAETAAEGYDAYNYDYPSSKMNIEAHTTRFLQELRTLMATLPPDERIYVLTHSMGGLILRGALARMTVDEAKRLEAIVMLGPPNKGSLWAYLGRLPIVGQLNESLGDMTPDTDSYTMTLPPPAWLPPTGIIAGRRDGKVALEDTGLPAPLPYQWLMVDCTHPGLRNPENVLAQVLNFFQTKHF